MQTLQVTQRPAKRIERILNGSLLKEGGTIELSDVVRPSFRIPGSLRHLRSRLEGNFYHKKTDEGTLVFTRGDGIAFLDTDNRVVAYTKGVVVPTKREYDIWDVYDFFVGGGSIIEVPDFNGQHAITKNDKTYILYVTDIPGACIGKNERTGELVYYYLFNQLNLIVADRSDGTVRYKAMGVIWRNNKEPIPEIKVENLNGESTLVVYGGITNRSEPNPFEPNRERLKFRYGGIEETGLVVRGSDGKIYHHA